MQRAESCEHHLHCLGPSSLFPTPYHPRPFLTKEDRWKTWKDLRGQWGKRVMSPVWCLTTVEQGKKVVSCLAFHLAFSGRLIHCSWEANWPDCFWCTHLTSCYIGHCRTVHLVLRNKKAVPKSPQKWIQSLLSWSLTTWKGFDGSWLGIFCSVTAL